MVKTRLMTLVGLMVILNFLLSACDNGNLGIEGGSGFLAPKPTPTASPVVAQVFVPVTPAQAVIDNPNITASITITPALPTATATATPPPTATATATATPIPVKTTKPTVAATTPVSPKTTVAITGSPSPTITTGMPRTTSSSYNGPLDEVVRGKTGKKEVAITLDAGAEAAALPKMLTALDKASVKITFFVTGTWAQQNPDYIQQMASSGHEIANHTWSHPDLTEVSDAQIKDEIERTDALLLRLTGRSTRPLWRAPYGSRNTHVLSVVNSLGYRSIMWTLDSLDSVGQPKSSQFLIDRVTGQSNSQLDGGIILMHVGNATTADALPAILQNLQQRSFKVVPISELLK